MTFARLKTYVVAALLAVTVVVVVEKTGMRGLAACALAAVGAAIGAEIARESSFRTVEPLLVSIGGAVASLFAGASELPKFPSDGKMSQPMNLLVGVLVSSMAWALVMRDRRVHHRGNLLILLPSLLLAGLFVGAMVWGLGWITGEIHPFDYALYFKIFLAVGLVGGLLATIPYLVEWFLAERGDVGRTTETNTPTPSENV
ncbi:hypothetical protein Pan216_37490 [Planctomycetes bacterium Pan216]|uniref:Uncharacterized protein n=1 Tax=Kolteria novifilia TaxID=2527975 RepID=A0A518B7C8_9BACT|nr:hypothetical protein Pan216_37490 [Planctomycetes bacterium Pan216]